jgi:phenylpyruvate tautomerase PptA (4-oxalocrotonate tautomerase family)
VPLYQCYSPKGLLTESAKAEIADEITTIHTAATGAPAAFVNVLFREFSEGDLFVHRQPSTRSIVLGSIRHGRSLETRQAMMRDYEQMWLRITGQSEADLLVALTEVDPAMALEAGFFMPEPGHEKEWFEEHRAKLTELGVTG